VRHHFAFSALANARHGNALVLAGAMFALGLAAGAAVRPAVAPQSFTQHVSAPVAPALAAAHDGEPVLPPSTPLSHRLDPSLVYPADVLRVIDGDTFEARVRVWPGLDVDTKVRLRGIDAAELHARCADELAKAQAARTALEAILAEGGVAVSRVGVDKYGGRVDATVSTRGTADVSAALLNGGFARSYDGGRRGTWCG
jgi:endonuclease YncB( thermonuclease family)